MISLLDQLHGLPVRQFNGGDAVIEQGTHSGLLYFLIDGDVEVPKDDVPIAAASEPGAVFGELSALLEGKHTATGRAVRDCSFSSWMILGVFSKRIRW